MINIINKLINKTPTINESNNFYLLPQFNKKTLEEILNHPHIGHGVFAIELHVKNQKKNYYLITPSFAKFSYEQNNPYPFEETNCYSLQFSKPSYMPLDVNYSISLLSQELNDVIIQVLITKRIDNWKDPMIDLYEEYLKGNDNPSTIKPLRILQSKMITSLTRLGNFEYNQQPIKEMEDKILDVGYRFEMRVIANNQSDINKLNSLLSKLNLFNQCHLEESPDILQHINERSFTFNSTNIILSQKEIYSLLSNKDIVTTPVLEKPSITKDIEESSFLQRAIQILPVQTIECNQVDDHLIKEVDYAFKRVKITDRKLQINNTHQGTTLSKIQIKIPPNVNFKQINNNLSNIRAALGNENIDIEIGDQPDTVNIYIPRKDRQPIFLRNVLESYDFKLFSQQNKLPFIIGENAKGGYDFACLTKLRHLLISGATGSGKSVFLNIFLICLILNVPPDELLLYLVDPKMVELSQYESFPQVQQIISDMRQATTLLSQLCAEMDKRYKIMANSHVKNIDTYNKKNPNKKMPYIVCVIDEYADLYMINPDVEEYLVRLGQKARAAGIHLVIATQRPSSDIVTGVLKSNLPSVISFRLKSSSDYMTVFGKGIPYQLLGKGDGVARIEGQYNEFERFQSPCLTTNEIEEEQIFEELVNLFKDVEKVEYELPELKEESLLDQLKRIIATTQETRITALQKQMKIRTSEVKNLMQQLVDEEWLKEPETRSKGYELIASEEELSKWRDDHD
jgi:DNA segregation ATPase FtsK/SpoIIIE, S-DNA-T family